MNIIKILEERGFIDKISSPNLKSLEGPVMFYWGIDPTADTLHLGHLVGVVAMSWLKRAGYKPFLLVGGATAKIGDPSGKSVERPILSDEVVGGNCQSIKTFLKGLLVDIQVVNNADWYEEMSAISFLRDVGRHFRLGPMLGKESVRTRVQSEEGMSFTEFSYQLLQGYDFYYLYKKYGVNLQIGGSDQWGNITAGIEFARKVEGIELFGFTFPLLTRSDGKKFGKTESGTIWLSKEKLSPYEFYQYLVQVSDSDVIMLLKMLTFLDMEEIGYLEKNLKDNPNGAQKRLAEEVTRFVHGSDAVEMALKVTKNAAPGSKASLDLAALEEIAENMPTVSIKKDEIVGMRFLDLAFKAGLSASKSEILRLVKGGGAYLNNERVNDPYYLMSLGDLIADKYLILSSGKKKKILISVFF